MAYYTRDDLLALWRSVTDTAYNEPFVRKGEGAGLEVYTQGFAQFERVSQAIEHNFQSLYALPWSGQTDQPATGALAAEVLLEFSRTSAPENFVILLSETRVQELGVDAGQDGPVEGLTGRYYGLASPVVFVPGTTGKVVVRAVAEMTGWGHNNPLPGALSVIDQPGSNVVGQDAVVVGEGLSAANTGDGLGPMHVGQYMQFTAGYNAGKVRRIQQYLGQTNYDAGNVMVEAPLLLTVNAVVGTFRYGEVVTHSVSSTAAGTVLYFDGSLLAVRRTAGFFPYGGSVVGTWGGSAVVVSCDLFGMTVAIRGPVVGAFDVVGHEGVTQAVSGATGIVAAMVGGVLYVEVTGGVSFDAIHAVTGDSTGSSIGITSIGIDPMIATETATAWRIMSWNELGLSVTNAESPHGGRSGMLDELGSEKRMPRMGNETDQDYRNRITTLDDTVAPNALKRAGIRGLASLGVAPVLREVGLRELPGIFYDVDPALAPDHAFAYDSTRDEDYWKLWLDYASFRAFFIMSVPQTNQGEFGFAYDGGPTDVYDALVLNGYDGYPVQVANTMKALWSDLNTRKAGGVGFELWCEPS